MEKQTRKHRRGRAAGSHCGVFESMTSRLRLDVLVIISPHIALFQLSFSTCPDACSAPSPLARQNPPKVISSFPSPGSRAANQEARISCINNPSAFAPVPSPVPLTFVAPVDPWVADQPSTSSPTFSISLSVFIPATDSCIASKAISPSESSRKLAKSQEIRDVQLIRSSHTSTSPFSYLTHILH